MALLQVAAFAAAGDEMVGAVDAACIEKMGELSPSVKLPETRCQAPHLLLVAGSLSCDL